MDGYRTDVPHQVTPEAITFFSVFSRFEFALKRGGFLGGAIGRKAAPDWDTFAGALGNDLFDRLRATKEADIFFTAQPKRLVRTGPEEVEFQDQAPIVNLQQLFEAVRLVRNNLFHGEKVAVSDRDRRLMAASLFVLDEAMEACAREPRCRRVPAAFAFADVTGER